MVALLSKITVAKWKRFNLLLDCVHHELLIDWQGKDVLSIVLPQPHPGHDDASGVDSRSDNHSEPDFHISACLSRSMLQLEQSDSGTDASLDSDSSVGSEVNE